MVNNFQNFLVLKDPHCISISLFRAENEERKKQLDEVSSWIKTENDKRMKEAEALKAR
jgi:hypothetical protein